MKLRTGQVLLFEVDKRSLESRLTQLVLLGNRFTHCALVVEDGDLQTSRILNTYPASDAVILPTHEVAEGRDFYVLDLRVADVYGTPWREAVAKAAHGLVGSEYWCSPCSRVTAQAFLNADVPLYMREMSLRERHGAILPHELATKTALTVVAAYYLS